MACKHCGLSDDSLNIPLKTPDIDSFPGSSNDLWAIVRNTDAEIARVETLLNQLILRRVLLKKEINYRSSPLLRISSDVTSQIFDDCLKQEKHEQAGHWHVSERDSRSALKPPLLFGSVCSAWRELAWSTPSLWSSITLELGTSPLISAILVAEWLSRSGQCALTISLTSTCTVMNTWNRNIITTLAGVSERWRHITFNLPPLYYEGFRSVEGRLPLLESVTMIYRAWMGYGVDDSRIFSVAPQLRVVHFDKFCSSNIVLPLAQLTTLSGYPCNDVLHCLSVLESAIQLVHASFIISAPTWPPPSRSPSPGPNSHRVVAPRLQSLEVNVGMGRSVNMLLETLDLPDVRELSFRLPSDLWSRSTFKFRPSSFTSFILRSACHLRSLSIFDCLTDDSSLLHCMQVIPSLTHLAIERVEDITEQTIRNLTPNTGFDVPLLPNLQTLTISSTTLAVDFVELHAMLSARWGRTDNRAVARLKFVSITGTGIHEASVIPGIPLLQQFIEEGMQVSVNTVVYNYPNADRVWL